MGCRLTFEIKGGGAVVSLIGLVEGVLYLTRLEKRVISGFVSVYVLFN